MFLFCYSSSQVQRCQSSRKIQGNYMEKKKTLSKKLILAFFSNSYVPNSKVSANIRKLNVFTRNQSLECFSAC